MTDLERAAQRYIDELTFRGITRVQILGVDFDNTITADDMYPKIGPIRQYALETLKAFQRAGGKVILKTCREGIPLEEARKVMAEHGFEPNAVNQNLADFALKQGLRKVYVDLDIDDRALGCPLDWAVIRLVLEKLGPTDPSKGVTPE